MNRPIYTIEFSNKKLAELHYTVPLTTFHLESDTDVTALHVAEHCAFGNYDRNEYFQTEAKKFNGGYLEATINKSWLAFHLLFESKYLNEAIKLFLEFISGLNIEIEPKTLEHYTDEVRDELLENKDKYEEMDVARAFLIGNVPFSLSSGGKAKYANKIKLEKVNNYLSIMADNGVITLTSTKSQFSQLKYINTPISELEPLVKIHIKIKNEQYCSEKLTSFVLSKMDEKQALELLYYLDYLIHSSKVKNLKVLVSNYPACTIVNFFHDNKNDLFTFAARAKQIKQSEITADIVISRKEHFDSIDNVSRFAIASYINGKLIKADPVSDKVSTIFIKIENL